MNHKVINDMEDIKPSENVFNDEDILNDILTSLKHLGTLYGAFISESSNKTLLSKIEKLSKTTADFARDSFNLLFEKGWYSLECAPVSTIEEKLNKFTNKKETFN